MRYVEEEGGSQASGGQTWAVMLYEDADELAEVYGRLQATGGPSLEEGATTCCYAKSEKTWIFDPQGVAWETFLTTGDSAVYGDSVEFSEAARQPS